MALNLSKGKPALNLTKSLPNKTKFTLGLAWDGDADFDASVVILDNGTYSDLVYYHNLTAAGITHNGDARDGSAAGDDETINIDLEKVEGDEVIAAITSYNSGTFGAAMNPVARLYEYGSTTPLIEAYLDTECAFGTALVLVRFFKEDGSWKFENISESIGSSANGLEDVAAKYRA